MRRSALLIGLSLSTAATAQAANIAPLPTATCNPAGGGAAVKRYSVVPRLSAEVLVNGRGPYKFIVDSSADSSAIGLRIVRDLRLPLGKPAILNGMSNRSIVDRVEIDELVLGPIRIRKLLLPALSDQDLGGDGLLGTDAFGRQRLAMDFEKQRITIEDARAPAGHNLGYIDLTARRQHGRLMLTDVKAAGIPLNAIIHTGSEITVGNFALRDQLLVKGARNQTVEVIGVAGEPVRMELIRVDKLQLGPVLLADVPIAFADAPPFKLWDLADRPALLMGSDLLSKFRRVSLDFRQAKVRLEPWQCT